MTHTRSDSIPPGSMLELWRTFRRHHLVTGPQQRGADGAHWTRQLTPHTSRRKPGGSPLRNQPLGIGRDPLGDFLKHGKRVIAVEAAKLDSQSHDDVTAHVCGHTDGQVALVGHGRLRRWWRGICRIFGRATPEGKS